jgi:hypothetical protein
MKTISVQISDVEYEALGIPKEHMSSSEFADFLDMQIARQAMRNCLQIAELSGLSSMTMDEINAEVNAVRQCHQTNNM